MFDVEKQIYPEKKENEKNRVTVLVGSTVVWIFILSSLVLQIVIVLLTTQLKEGPTMNGFFVERCTVWLWCGPNLVTWLDHAAFEVFDVVVGVSCITVEAFSTTPHKFLEYKILIIHLNSQIVYASDILLLVSYIAMKIEYCDDSKNSTLH